jgi:adenosylcobinamide-GDP ribazoletransferase
MAATTILIAAALSRAMIVLALYLLSPAREQGLGTVAGAPPRPAMLIALITGVIPLLLLWSPIGMGLALLAAFIGLILVSRVAMKAVDGYTGDILGAIQQVSETTIMITLLIVSQHTL